MTQRVETAGEGGFETRGATENDRGGGKNVGDKFCASDRGEKWGRHVNGGQ